MFAYGEFVAKAQLYFGRAAAAPEHDPEQRSLWLLLGLEFLIRAPLAKVHPTLLALPGDDSILHAAGIEIPTGKVKSIPMKTVLVRLTKIDPNFGEDRATSAAFLTDIRNGELHTSSAALANTPEAIWLPRFLTVLEAICAHLGIDPAELVDGGVLEEARHYRETSDRKIQADVEKLSKSALIRFSGLSEAEISSRLAQPSPILGGVRVNCPVCGRSSAWVRLSEERKTEPKFNEETQEIAFKGVSVVESLQCSVCGITLETTAQVMAAGFDRLHVTEYTEDRYEGWEDQMTYEDAMAFLGEGEDYENE